MSLVSMTKTGICLLVICLLAGCAPARVRDVLADQAGYLAAHFSPDSLPPSVRGAVLRTDPGPLGFERMELQIDWVAQVNGKTESVHSRDKLTLIDAGGSFVQKRSEYARNGVPVTQDDALTYRGLFTLRSQSFSIKGRNGGLLVTAHEIRRFEPIVPAATTLGYDYTVGVPTQYAGFAEHKMTCDIGKAYPASRVFEAFAGQARDLECTWYNSNGAPSGRTRLAYLQQYGVAIQLSETEASGVALGTVTSASIK